MVEAIPLARLAIVFIPVIVVLGILLKWSLDVKTGAYAMFRMLIQLLLIGYLLTYIFESDSGWIVIAVLSVMLFFSSWIALRTVKADRKKLYLITLISITVGGVSTLAIVSQGVLNLRPWFSPQYLIPLAGMIFANAMNSVSLAADRLYAELGRGVDFLEARKIALQTALIPITNSLFAVGLVSLPGMMTGQILSGVSPLIAARYQIMVMCMIFASTGISTAVFLVLAKSKLSDEIY